MATDLLIVHTAGPASTGPNSPTIAVAEEARARGLNVETLELFEDAPRSLGFLYAQFHATGRARLPRLYGRAVAVKGVDAEAYVRLRNLANRSVFRHFLQRVRELSPRAIVATHPLPMTVLGPARVRGDVDCELFGVVTQRRAHAAWAQPGVDAYCVPGTEALFDLMKGGIESGRVRIDGFPVSRAFYNVSELRSPGAGEPHRVLVNASSLGASELRDIIRSFARCVHVHVDVLCGLDDDLRTFADQELERALVRGDALGYVASRADEIARAHVFVAHADGPATHEAMAAGRPMISVNATTAAELANERALFQAHAGHAARASDVGPLFAELLAADALGRLGSNGRRASHGRAATSIVDRITARPVERSADGSAA